MSYYSIFRAALLPKSLCLMILLASNPSEAQLITQDQGLDFGEIALTDNSASHQIDLDADGSYTTDADIISIWQPNTGQFTLSGFTPGTVVDLTFNDPQTYTNTPGGTATFNFTSPTANPSTTLTIDGAGEANFTLGGILETNGNSATHLDGNYSSNSLQITATPRFGPDGTALLTITQDVVVDSVIDLIKDSDIEFGTVAAYAFGGDSAPLQITPNGVVSGGTDGNAFVTIVDDSSATAAQITMTNVAPNSTIHYHVVNDTSPQHVSGDSFVVESFQTQINAEAVNASVANDQDQIFTSDGSAATNETLKIGLNLTTPNASKLLTDGAYSGNFTVTIGY